MLEQGLIRKIDNVVTRPNFFVIVGIGTNTFWIVGIGPNTKSCIVGIGTT